MGEGKNTAKTGDSRITDWSVDLNGDVRNGVMSLDDFFAKWNPKVNGEEDYKKNLAQSKYMTIKWKGLQ